MERGMSDIEPIAQRKLFEVLRQFIRFRYLGALEQDWDHGDIALESGPDLDPDRILRVIQTAISSFITRIEPVGSDQRKQHLAFGDRISQGCGEIYPQWDRVHVHEEEIVPKLLH
jgi:hypothetical protein